MFPWRELLQLIIETFPLFLRRGDLLVIVSVVLLLVYMQYRRTATIEQSLFGVPLSDPLKNTLTALGIGFAGGWIGTFLFVVLGVSLTDVGIGYLWVLAIAMMLLHPRFVCFAYGGGLLSISHLLFGWPDVNVPAMMALVGVLHLVESLLIFVHGHRDPTPVYVRRSDGRVVGGFTLQKFWPMPFIALVAILVSQSAFADRSLAMPDWWPLIQPRDPAAPNAMYLYVLFPVIAALGYGDIAITTDPRRKARRTSGLLLGYSVVLMLLALAGSAGQGAQGATWLGVPVTVFQWLAALFSPLGHELVIHLSRRMEERGQPLYDSAKGAVVLGVVPGSPAARMGLERGDIIRSIGGFPVFDRADIQEVLTPWAVDVDFVVENMHTGQRRTVRCPGKIPPLGVIFAPAPGDPGFMSLDDRVGYGLMLRRLSRRLARLLAGRTAR